MNRREHSSDPISDVPSIRRHHHWQPQKQPQGLIYSPHPRPPLLPNIRHKLIPEVVVSRPPVWRPWLSPPHSSRREHSPVESMLSSITTLSPRETITPPISPAPLTPPSSVGPPSRPHYSNDVLDEIEALASPSPTEPIIPDPPSSMPHPLS
ncbi:uncharacterized protein EI90DRAFT_3039343 [Cantharellus anzutake]|uniref:uncharacterized protein n=1 Tax=Cantharellus anzutake TaxID=1750568 RepID=UPI001908CE51|nr:uncharacterized protein EI90DRAFT_3039343 [Cantharellus anzutake]KAF8338839.1 hypothetical protein EI90DRAFT_3039343 [Cantharellus anzutake]